MPLFPATDSGPADETGHSHGCLGHARFLDCLRTVTRGASGRSALLLVDLDNFKYINSAHGHAAGDVVLDRIKRRLQDAARKQDVVVRLCGDEFAVLLVEGAHAMEAEAIARRIVEALTIPIPVNGRDILVSASIGISRWHAGIDAAEELLRRADIALHGAKTTNRGGFKFFDRGMDQSLRERQELAQEFRKAVAEQSLEVHYQPIVHLASDEITGFEALVRWRHASRGTVSPAEFIPIAEDLGLIGSLGDWVLRRACADAAKWPEHVKISVNFSRTQLESAGARARVEAALRETGLPATRLQLEITETKVMADVERVYLLLDELRELGIGIAMDDFGTGYSSLGFLRNCPFDRLKIDRVFIQDLSTSLEARAIFTMIVKLATALGMHTTAEGVETREQYEIVKQEGCGEMQGFFFSPPKTAEQVLSLFQSHASGDTAA